jgi:16S rRNA (cytosine1402-N4)-methyltransferase
MTAPHVPVLADAVAQLASGSRRAVDATVGDGGHTQRLRDLGAEVLAVDCDPDALAGAQERLGSSGIHWVRGRFGAPEVLRRIQEFGPDFALFDLGVSSRHFDDAGRGFSFRPNTVLDMRMDRSGPTAADLLNTIPRDELATIFREYADERKASRLATTITRRRQRQPFRISDDLVNAIRAALGPRSGPSDFARLFQAVRVAVNDELRQLERALPAVRAALVPGGRLAVISYHSGEDRIVKRMFREWATDCVCPPGQPVCTCRGRALGQRDPRRPIVSSDREIAMNPRARSAKLRGFLCGGHS